MKTITNFIIILFLSTTTAVAQQTFEKIYDFNLKEDDGIFITQMPDHGYLMVGQMTTVDDTIKVNILRTNEFGDTLWTKNIGNSLFTEPNDVVVTSDSGLMILAFAGDAFPQYYHLLIKTDNQGDTLWTKKYFHDFGLLLCQTFDDGYAVLGNFGNDRAIIKLNEFGDSLWASIINSPLYLRAEAIIQSSDSNLVFTGSLNISGGGPGQDSSMVMIGKADTSGNLMWMKSFVISQHSEGNNLIQTADGGFGICGFSERNNERGVCIIKTDNMGDTTWTMQLNFANTSSSAYAINEYFDNSSQCPGDGFIVTGHAENSIDNDFLIVRTNSTGDTLWTRIIDYAIHGNCIIQSNDNGIVAVGAVDNPNILFDEDLYLIKTDACGVLTSVYQEPFLKQIAAFPNPFRLSVQVSFSADQNIRAYEIYDIYGRIIFKNSILDGTEKLVWDGRDAAGKSVNNGIYIINLIGQTNKKTIRLIKID